ncbi:MAG TPA: [protein-PII] uridylyltransferase [Acidobacteriaceae bacterium]|nr:[protein-PII] uridylyltransferase [Acidobacteriaceae bacterium]
MKAAFTSHQQLRDYYQAEMAAMRQSFERTGNGVMCIRRRALVVDCLLDPLWRLESGGPLPEGLALIAIGGFGRKELFPSSDVDLLYLCSDEQREDKLREGIRACNQAMWDLGLRASPMIRTLKECDRYDPDNIEFTLSLLDRRFLAGDHGLDQSLQTQILPGVALREWSSIVHRLADLARARHQKYGNTIFHLEPNIKECPGGLRDHQLAQWLSLLNYVHEQKAWPSTYGSSLSVNNEAASAFEFLSATRCFLHLRSGRDDNTLDWQAQDEAAAQSVGLETKGTSDPAYWMRTYYRHARTVYRRAILAMEALPPARQSFYRPQRRKRVPIPGTDFVVQDGRVDVSEAALLTGPEGILRVFALIAAHGYRLTQNAEERLADALPVLDVHIPEGPFLWNALREILLGPHAAHALRTMHALGILELLIPEFHGIDALVIRDSYHRYTVDEHTFLVIDNVHALRQPHLAWERRFSTLLAEIDRLDLFFLALLMHDTGKARRSGEHTVQSVELADSLLARLELDAEERDMVRRLIRNHLEMSITLRRDIFDTETIRAFAEKVASQAHLKMLCLMTYADIKAVNPDALTPWKADSLWQLYIATSNFMDRSVDQERYRADLDPTQLKRILTLAPESAQELRTFLEGFPQRYLQTRMPEQIRDHFQMALQLSDSAAQVNLRSLRHFWELTVITRDRPLLFADMAGALSSWGMNIVKAEAFSDDAGIIVDTFQFSDPFRTLELNPSEVERFRAILLDVISMKTPIEVLLRRRPAARAPIMVRVETRLDFDNTASTHSTLLQVVAQDGTGLLRQIATTLAAHDCNIEVALIDTEGEIAIDVFYLTIRGSKLDETKQEQLRADLMLAIEELRPAHAGG